MKFQSINPFNNKVLEEFDVHSGEEVTQKLDRALEVQKSWRRTDFAHRSLCLQETARILVQNKKVYADTITREMGKPIGEALAEVEKCAWVCEYYAENGAEFLKSREIKSDADLSRVQFQPLGIILAIMPWNFPFWQVFRFAVPALMAGNAALLKHAPNVLQCAGHIEKIFVEAGFPMGIFQNLFIEVDRVADVIKDPRIKAVTLTGSERAGTSVAALAGRYIKKTVLELGGSNAFVVLKDADLEQALDVGVKARMLNSGQSCIAAKRFILEKDIAQEFLAELKQRIESLRLGDPLDPATQIGPLARVDLAEQLEKQVQQSMQLGATLLTGGSRTEAKFVPAILTGVLPGMPAFEQELFGPVASVIVANSAEQALDLANNSRFGLGASVFTRSPHNAQMFIENIEDGAVFINDLVKSDPRLPFGGTKSSGYGRELSVEGIREFVNIKTVYIKDLPDGK